MVQFKENGALSVLAASQFDCLKCNSSKCSLQHSISMFIQILVHVHESSHQAIGAMKFMVIDTTFIFLHAVGQLQ